MRLRPSLFAVGILMLAARPILAAEIKLPDGPDRALVYGKCRTCHDLQYIVESAGITRGDWEGVVDSMKMYGLELAPDTRKKILNYLATYLGPKPPPSAPAKTSPGAPPVAGETIYAEQCSACHGKDGRGTGTQFPPLAGNRDLFIDRLFPVYVVLHGLSGPIDVAGRRFNSVMPPFAHLSDAEIAAVINHVRTSWGNGTLRPGGMQPIDAATVKKARGESMTAAGVHAYRSGHK